MSDPNGLTHLPYDEQRRRDLEELARAVARLSKESPAEWEARREAEAVRADIPFLPTSVATVIFSTIERCLRFGQNGTIIGTAGVGKTKALEEAVRRSEALEGPRTALVTVTGAIGASTLAIFEEVCPHLGVRPAPSIAETQRRLMRDACFAPVVLFDEAQNLTLKAIRDLLEISKTSRIPMVFCGNAEILKLVNSAQAAIQQISRRLPVREEITSIDDADADLIAGHFGVEGMDAFHLCRELGRVFHADGIVTVLKAAQHVVGAKTIRLHHIREALEIFPHFKAGLAKAAKERDRVSGVRPLKQRAIK